MIPGEVKIYKVTPTIWSESWMDYNHDDPRDPDTQDFHGFFATVVLDNNGEFWLRDLKAEVYEGE